jgi:hypothetical protein
MTLRGGEQELVTPLAHERVERDIGCECIGNLGMGAPTPELCRSTFAGKRLSGLIRR